MPTFYSSKDAGLPAFYISTTASLQRFTNYKLIFKACLVSGYGSRAAAGWTLVDEGDQFLVLRNAAGNYFTISSAYYVISTGLAYHGAFRVFLHATYTGMGSTGIPQGQGVVSGTSGAATLPVYFGSDLLYWNANTRWVLLADEQTFIFTMLPFTGNASAITGTNIDSTGSAGTLYVGADLGGNHIAAGGYRAATPNTHQLTLYFDRVALTTLRNPKTGLLVDTGGIAAWLDGVINVASAPTTTHTNTPGISVLASDLTELPTLEMHQLRWLAAGQPQPGLRGMRRENLLIRHYANPIRRLLEGSLTTTDYTGDSILNLNPLSDGYCYLPLQAAVGGRGSAIITDNPAYW
ncbi:hypothetical protein [Pseudomonas sp.]|uniref:hypothetical protein n=1 Tax=Pseudomonas sp. TaxID=306 RepID=UPI002730B8E5|nr:hypothetical protein [Pseudomonas sp.]MDP2444156.1 hypothetical protein [Pseudomonas sp.]MDZ4337112.1 hypothetical protein [Pseudomonas sp.]